MATVAVPQGSRQGARKYNWAAFPWQMIGAGVALCMLALLIRLLGSDDDPGPGRLLVLTAGLLAAGISVAVRVGSSAPPFLDRFLGPSRQLVLTLLMGLFGALVLAATVVVILSFFEY